MIRDTVQEEALLALVSQDAARKFLVRRGPEGEGWTLAVASRCACGPTLTAVDNYAEWTRMRGFGVEL